MRNLSAFTSPPESVNAVPTIQDRLNKLSQSQLERLWRFRLGLLDVELPKRVKGSRHIDLYPRLLRQFVHTRKPIPMAVRDEAAVSIHIEPLSSTHTLPEVRALPLLCRKTRRVRKGESLNTNFGATDFEDFGRGTLSPWVARQERIDRLQVNPVNCNRKPLTPVLKKAVEDKCKAGPNFHQPFCHKTTWSSRVSEQKIEAVPDYKGSSRLRLELFPEWQVPDLKFI